MDEREKIKAALEQGSKAFSVYFRSELRKALDSGKGHFGTKDTAKTVVDFVADALIAANIGDVTEWKERAEKAEERLEEQKAVDLYRMDMEAGKIDMTVGSEGFRDFFIALAQIFEQNNATRFLATSFEIKGNKYGITIQKVGEKTVADELNMLKSLYEYQKHRADVAERALSWLCDETMRDIRIIMYPTIGKQVRDKQELYDHCIEQAEKELAKEGQ